MTWEEKKPTNFFAMDLGLVILVSKTLVKQLNQSIPEGQASPHRQQVGCGGCSIKTEPPPCSSAAVLQLCSSCGWAQGCWRQSPHTRQSVRHHPFVSQPAGITLVLYKSVPQRKGQAVEFENSKFKEKKKKKSLLCLKT